MGASEENAYVISSRLKREDCNLPKHDSAFSQWKVLIGPSDWEDHSLGKEGAERYKVHNLPNCSSCSGLYELGIVVPHTRSGREIGKLDRDLVIPVYLGQADNVRSRLQRYGRDGAHLENGNVTGQLNEAIQQGPRLFSDIFSSGFSIVYRWAPMKSKRDAEKTETRLLNTFDYAWNKGNNGVRRHNDIIQLDRSTSSYTQFLALPKKIQTFHRKQIGVEMDNCKPLLFEKGSTIYTNRENNGLLSQILKVGRSQPRPVSLRFGFNDAHASICGVALGHGSVCRKTPVEGRKRCSEHKGMKVNGFSSELIKERKSVLDDLIPKKGITIRDGDPEHDGHRAPSLSYYTVKPQPVLDNCSVFKDSFLICGVSFDDGTLCRRPPVLGRKRCEDHKGRKLTGFLSKLVTEDPKSEKSVINDKLDIICGVNLKDGTFCTRQPVIGRKRCEEHKGMRINGYKSKFSVVANLPGVFDDSGVGSCSGPQKYDNAKEVCFATCGATLVNGSSCRRSAAEGSKRCWQHKGMKANTDMSFKINYAYDTAQNTSDICGADLRNGSICSRMPVRGRKRCEQHKGMRVTF
ncbi:hypothetical protein U1Q18_049205 [Sarracenia purpurea var. burkii]